MSVLADALKLWPGSIPKLSFLEKLLHPAADPPPALVTALKVSTLSESEYLTMCFASTSIS